MSEKDGGQPEEKGVHRSRAAGLSRPRMAVAGLAGLALLGGGAYLVTTRSGDDGGTTATRDVGVVAPSVGQGVDTTSLPPSAPAPTSAAAVASADAVAPTSASATTTAPRTRTPATRERDPAEVRREIAAAREKAAKDGIKLQRPPKAKAGALAQNLISTRTEPTSEGTIRITTAPGDLTGQQDQLLAGDDGRRVGTSRCTQSVRFTRSAPARVIPNMLLCWRTSDSRSVVTMAVARKGKPSAAASTAVIDREWAKLR